jgi:hypothetical protein
VPLQVELPSRGRTANIYPDYTSESSETEQQQSLLMLTLIFPDRVQNTLREIFIRKLVTN